MMATVSAAQGAQGDPAEIVTRTGSYGFEPELATTPGEQERGLMERTAVATTGGMIFDFHGSRRVKMWMHDTRIAMDLVFCVERRHGGCDLER